MIHLSKSVLAVSGAVLAAGLIAFTNPKTVHAVAAALVEVTNTAANPVVTQSTAQQATQLVQLSCNMNFVTETGGSGSCNLLSPTMGLSGTAYIVPSNQSLVVTAVDIVPDNYRDYCGGGVYGESLQIAGSGIVPYAQLWTVSFSGTTALGATAHFTYPSGMAFAPNSTLTAEESSGCPANFELTGYLTNS
ncbi:MAG TPA: hypothetical protein VHY48_00580 [Acidobacteriaceae bacterium]|nr:hypothetical protein [Acidobacteriaceae bacterium]